MIRNRAQIEALVGGQALVQALDDLFNEATKEPFSIGTARIHSGAGAPENRILGAIGDLYLRTDGSTGTTLYVKESGKNSTVGWIAK